MDRAARVLDECVARPDDDAPRLVWADLVGGERGELVVIQCDLARGGLSPRETARRRRRERELLETHGVAWAGELPSIASRWLFHRGFVEAVRLESVAPIDPATLAAHPLLASVAVADSRLGALDELARRGIRLRGLEVMAYLPLATEVIEQLAAAPALRALRALRVHELQPAATDVLRRWIAVLPLTLLGLPDCGLGADEVTRVLAAASHLASLELHGAPVAPLVPIAARRPLRALSLDAWLDDDAGAVLANAADTLEHLRVVGPGEALAALLAGLPALRTLEIAGGDADAFARALAGAPGLAQLATLRIEATLAPSTARALAERFGPQLALLELPAGTAVPADLVAVAGELRLVDAKLPPISVLPHHAADRSALAPPCFVRSQAMCLARLDIPGAIWDIPALPADERVVIGRSTTNLVHIVAASIARRHAALTWRDGHHVVADYGSTNGTIIGGERIDNAPLVDGTALELGSVILQYFVGPGARQRAEDAIAATRVIEPATRLPRNSAPPALLRIANWDAILARYGATVAPSLLRAVADQLARELAGGPLWFVRPGDFGVTSLAIAQAVAHPREIDVGVPIAIELVAEQP